MKTRVLFSAVLAASVMMGSVKAQLQINSDGGVRIGTAPTSGWTLSSNGFELNYGDIILHTGGSGFVKITSSVNQTLNPLIETPISLIKTHLTGKGLCLGASDNYVSSIYVTNITSKNDVSVTSDRRAKENIQTITGARDAVLRLHPVTYDLKVWDGYIGDGSDLKGKAGFIAQEVLDVLPDAVGYDEKTDRYSLHYMYFIPYLTQALQEQDEQIREMEDRIARLEEMLESLLPSSVPAPKNRPDNGSKTSENSVPGRAVLYQNTPNPFSESTVIRYNLDKPADASLVVKDMRGRMVYKETLKKDDLSGQVEIQAGKLAPGLYTYSLVAAGRTLDSKKMVVTE